MASAISAVSSAASAATSGATDPLSAQPNEQMFLQLLVSQLQNQDPLNPADSTQFVAELAQFSELEQVIGIRGDIETIMANNTAASSTTGTSSSSPAPASNAASSSAANPVSNNNSSPAVMPSAVIGQTPGISPIISQ